MIKAKRNDTIRLSFTWKDSSGDVVNLTGATATFGGANKAGAVFPAATISIATGTGIVSVFQPLTNVTPGIYNCDQQIALESGDIISTDTFQIQVVQDYS